MLQAMRPLQHSRAAARGGRAQPSTVGLGSNAHLRSEDSELQPKELWSVRERAPTALLNDSWPGNATATQSQSRRDQTNNITGEGRASHTDPPANALNQSRQQEDADAFPSLAQAESSLQTHDITNIKYNSHNNSIVNASDQSQKHEHADTSPHLGEAVLAQIAFARGEEKSYISWSSETVPLLLLFLAVGAIVLTCFASMYYTCFAAAPNRSIDSSNALRPSFAKPPMRHNMDIPYHANTSATLPPRTTTSRLGPVLKSQPQRTALAWPLSPGPSFSQLPIPMGANSRLSLPAAPAAGTSADVVQQVLPLTLCPALVLAARDANLEISVDALLDVMDRRSDCVYVLGPLGNKLLRVTLDGNVLDVYMAQQSERIASVSLQASDGLSLEVRRHSGAIFGRIAEQRAQPPEPGKFSFAVVAAEGEVATPLLLVTASRSSGSDSEHQLLAPLSAVSFDSSLAGSATVQRKRGMSCLHIKVARNSDTALILSSFLAILLLLHPSRGRGCHHDKDIVTTLAQGGA